MTSRILRTGAAAAAAVLLGSSPALAFDPQELAGKPLDKAEQKLYQRGFSRIGSSETKNRSFQYWWSARDKTCAILKVDLKGKQQKVVDAAKVNKKECKQR